MEDLARRSDDITTESIRQRDKLLLRQSGKLEQAMAQVCMPLLKPGLRQTQRLLLQR